MTFTIVHLLPELLGTYGDRGNLDVLQWRLKQREIAHDVVTVHARESIPDSGDLYLLGGGEDDAQIAAAEILRKSGALNRALDTGGQLLAICAGFQLLGESFPASHERTIAGLEILPIRTNSAINRSVGELLSESTTGIGLLTGFENHGGQTHFLADLQPLGKVRSGIGNNEVESRDGVVTSHVVATYMHGPALARNPKLADFILERSLGKLTPLERNVFDELHERRVSATYR
jgi:CobQ-like glutamine amidotransferase family enzyme